jgi:hypothetical protein
VLHSSGSLSERNAYSVSVSTKIFAMLYSPVHGFWSVEELAELAEGPNECGEVAKGGCLFAGTSM